MSATLDYATITAIAKDTGNRNMQRAGRKSWGKDDWNAAAREFQRLVMILERENAETA